MPVNDLVIRTFEPSDAPRLTEIYLLAVETIGPQRYDAAQVQAWKSLAPSATSFQSLCVDGRIALVAESLGCGPIAFGDLRPDGRINYFYCRPDHTRTGATLMLYQRLESAARSLGLELISVEASEFARSFFERTGFSVQRKQDVRIGSVRIHNYAMDKKLRAT